MVDPFHLYSDITSMWLSSCKLLAKGLTCRTYERSTGCTFLKPCSMSLTSTIVTPSRIMSVMSGMVL